MSREEILMHLKECIFDGELSENNYYSKIMNFLPKDVTVESGVTKMALFFPNTDFVVKIPFNGTTQHHYEWNDETDEYEDTGEVVFEPFEEAYTNSEDDTWNYCQTEVEVYAQAKDAGVAEFFLEMELFAVLNDQPIYIQQKAEIFEDIKDIDDYDSDTTDTTRKKCRDRELRCFNACWISDAFKYYEEKKVFEFLKFADRNLEDLHTHNIGYVNDKPVIIDYAGYHEE